MTYFLSFMAIVVGFLLVAKTPWFLENFGRSSWAEQHMGSFMFYKLLGILTIIIAILIATGWMGDIVLLIFAPLFGF